MDLSTRQLIAANLQRLMERTPALDTQQKLASRSGVGQTTIGRILRADVSPTVDNLQALAKAFGIQLMDLVNPGLFRGAAMAQQGEVMFSLGARSGDIEVAPGPDIKGKIPLISWVQAGDWCEAIDNYAPGDAEDWLPCPFEHGPHTFCLAVVGQSMAPDYREGEIIAVDPSVEARHGKDIVCRTLDGRVTFKRLQITPDGTYLLALNPEWPSRMIAIPDDTRICGVVIGSWVYRN